MTVSGKFDISIIDVNFIISSDIFPLMKHERGEGKEGMVIDM